MGPTGNNGYGQMRHESQGKLGFLLAHWPRLVALAMLLWALAVSCWGTAHMAALLGFDPTLLGEPLLTIGSHVWYAPWKVYAWGEAFKDSYGPVADLVNRAYALGVGLPCLVFGALVYLGSHALTSLKGRPDLHGSAHWATMEDIKRYGYLDGKGVYVGGVYDEKAKKQYFLRHDGPEHVLCFAPTRAGKGVGLIIPSLLVWEHSSVVLDIKGENFALTSGYLSSIGHKVIRFDPADATGSSASFNPLAEVELDKISCIPDIQRVAVTIMDPEGKGLTEYWDKAANGFFAGALLHCLIMTAKNEGRAASLYDVAVMLADPKRPVSAVFQEMLDTDHATILAGLFPYLKITSEEDVEVLDGEGQPIVNLATGETEKRHVLHSLVGDSAHVFIASAGQEIMGKSAEELSGVVNTAISNLALYKDPVVAANITRSDFKLRDIMNHEQPVNLYLVFSPNDIARLRPLLRVVIAQMMGSFTRGMKFKDGIAAPSYKHRCLLMLDEFASLGKMATIKDAIAYMAGYGVKGYFIVQNIEQLNDAYTKSGGVSIMANCHVRVVYAPNEPDTARMLSDLAGTTTVVGRKKSMSVGGKGGSNSYSVDETSRPLITPGECMTLPSMEDLPGGGKSAGDMLIFTAGKKPIYGRQILFFQHPELKRRSAIPVPGLDGEHESGVSHSLYYRMPVPIGEEAVPLAAAAAAEPAPDLKREYLARYGANGKDEK